MIAVLGIACTTLRGRADEAYARGDYLEAAKLYDQMVAAEPDNAEALERRFAARAAALRAMLQATQLARSTGRTEAAINELARLLHHRDLWAMPPDPDLVAPIAAEVTAATAHVQVMIDGLVMARRPLGAQQTLGRFQSLLSRRDFDNRYELLRTTVAAAGRRHCDKLIAESSTAATPYWNRFLNRYCAYWGSATRRDAQLPHVRSGLLVVGGIHGESRAQISELQDALAAAFAGSVWFDPAATMPAHCNIDGHVTSSFTERSVSLTKNWNESVPYTAYETKQVAYQEPYTETETRYEQVPHIEYETRTVSCGSGTCTETTPRTVYKSEPRTETVTKYRTAYRTETHPVTRYRDVPQVFSYLAIERTGHYASSLRARAIIAGEPIVAEVASAFSRTGIEHNVSFPPAGISPEQADLLSGPEFVEREHASLRQRLARMLDDNYRQLYCSSDRYTADQAAACAYLDPVQAPAPVQVALRELLGDDAPLASQLLGR
ncbi:MAG: hypothetical protein AB7P03_21510 [Kofleriaceae bacterium]